MATASKNRATYATKKCPYCFTHMPISAAQCPACKNKVGGVDKLGFADKPVNWSGYAIAVLACAAFLGFVWWAFIKG